MKFNKWTLAKQLWFQSILFMVNILFVGFFEWRNSHQLVENLKEIADHQLPAIHNMALADMTHEGLEAITYHSLIASEKHDAEGLKKIKLDYQETAAKGLQYLKNISELKLSEAQVIATHAVVPKFKEYIAAGQQIVDLAASNQRGKALALMENYHKSFEMMETNFDSLGTLIGNESKNSRNQSVENAAKAEFWNIFIVVLSVLAGFGIAFFLISNMVRTFRKIITQISEEVVQLGSSSSQVSITSQHLAEAATEQSAAIEETVSSMEEITSMLDQTSHHSGKTLQISDDSQRVADEGKTTISRLSSAMEAIEDSTSKLERIVGLIDDIRQKTRIINDIVFETRLLSFNASIEAARAGVHGKGFAVVAEEVGKLASMSGKSAEEIRTLLDSSTKEVADVVAGTRDRILVGKQASLDCGTAFNSMRDTLEVISESVKSIAGATKEQHVGIKQTNQAMQEMESATQSNSRAAENFSEHSKYLDTAAKNLNQSLGLLKQLVVKNTSSSAAIFETERVSDSENKSETKIQSKSDLPTHQLEVPVSTVSLNQSSRALKFRSTSEGSEETTSNSAAAVVVSTDIDNKAAIVKPEAVGRGDSRWKSA